MNSRDIARSHAWHGPYRRPTTMAIRTWLFACVVGWVLGAITAARF